MMNPVLSGARAWLPLLLHPRRSIRSFIACWSFYDAAAWEPQLAMLESADRLMADMLVPALLLMLAGSMLPSTHSTSDGGIPSIAVDRDVVDAFSPCTSHASALSLMHSPPSSTVIHSILSNIDAQYLQRLLALTILSPTSIDAIFCRLVPVLRQVLSRLWVVLMSRKGADAATKEALRERVRSERVIRRHAYDLYLPPKTIDAKKGRIRALLFFPGFGIHHEVYADVAYHLSEYGIPVAVASLEPLRLAYETLGAGIRDVTRIIASAGEDVVRYCKSCQHGGGNAEGPIEVEWALGGHSMGGYNALQLAEEMQTNAPTVTLAHGSISKIGPQIVAWAAGTVVKSVPNIRRIAPSLRVFLLLASNDTIAQFASPWQRRELIRKLPRGSKLVEIEGGNHSGFASYDEDSKRSATYLINGPRDISLEEQQAEAARSTAKFLLEN
ncbi:hypothetical protein ACHAXT_004600 [Thalassiosira profunda]